MSAPYKKNKISLKIKRKIFGQHYLKDKTIIQKIVSTVVLEQNELKAQRWLEIGPGMGALTLPLLEAWDSFENIQMIIAEKDTYLINHWKKNILLHPKSSLLSILEGDFLNQNLDFLTQTPEKTLIVSNLPYSAGTAIFTKLALFPHHFSTMILMFQKEVAQRLYAHPGTKAWGSLSLWTQNQWDVTPLYSVPPEAFQPPPKVQSEVILVKAKQNPEITGPLNSEELELWEQTLKVFFNHRRKMLRAYLPEFYLKALSLAQLPYPHPEQLRAEQLNFNDWRQLWNAVKKLKN
jgi:16S rRNA (adenine1518-N6/adenine1519-N6)-dimethyltransferase